MNKELEALLLTAAKATSYGVVGVDQERANDWGVRVAKFTREGELPEGGRAPAKTSGYYAKRGDGQPTPKYHLGIEANSPGDGWTRYSLFVYSEDTTGVRHFRGQCNVYTLAEMKAYLRGVACGATP